MFQFHTFPWQCLLDRQVWSVSQVLAEWVQKNTRDPFGSKQNNVRLHGRTKELSKYTPTAPERGRLLEKNAFTERSGHEMQRERECTV